MSLLDRIKALEVRQADRAAVMQRPVDPTARAARSASLIGRGDALHELPPVELAACLRTSISDHRAHRVHQLFSVARQRMNVDQFSSLA